jgi:hypothetical protein
MHVWIVEVDWGRDDYNAIVGVAATLEAGQRMAVKHAEEHHYSIMPPWDWRIDDKPFPYAYCRPYSVDPYEVEA